MFTRKKSLDGIVSSFTKTIADLDTLIAGHTAEAEAAVVEAGKLLDKRTQLADEAAKAERIRANISALVSPAA